MINQARFASRDFLEEELLIFQQKLSFHLENTTLGCIEWDNQLNVKYLSRKAEAILGWSKKDFSGHKRTGFTQVYEEDMPLALKTANELLSGLVSRNTVQYRNITKDGRVIWCEWFNSALKDRNGKVTSILSLVQDITEQKETQEKLKKLTHLYAFTSQVNKDIVHVNDEATLFRNACSIATELGHFNIAWIGLFNDAHTAISLVAQSGLPEADIPVFNNTPFQKNDPLDNVLQTGRHFSCQDAGNDARFEKWNPFIQRNGLRSCMVLPIKKSGSVVGTFNLYTRESGFSDAREIELLERLTDDISFALERFDETKRQKETEDLVIHNEKKFRHTLDNMLEGVQMHDFNWRYIYVNDALVNYGHYLREEMIGHTLMEIYPGIEQTDLYKTMHRCMHERIAAQLNTEFIFPDGRKGYFELSINPIPEGISILTVDRTEQRAAKESVAGNERRFRALIENGADMITLSAESGEMLYASPSVTKVFGYTPEEIRHTSVFDFVHPDDIQKFITNRNIIILKNGSSYSSQLRLLHKNGSWIWCEATLTNMLHEQGIHAMVSNFRDISEKKTAELQKEFERNNLSALINNTKDLMWSVDRNFVLITCNQAFIDIIRFMSGKSVERESDMFSMGFPAEQMSRYKIYYERAFAGETFTEIEYTSVPVDFWSEISFQPIRIGDEVIGAACHSRDITERKRTEEILSQNQVYLNEAQRLAKLGSWNYDIVEDNLTWSEELYNIFGTNKQTFIETHGSFLNLVDPEDREHAFQTSKHTQETGEPFTIEYRITTPNGEKRVLREHGYGERDDNGKIIRLFGTAQDITEQVASRKKIERSEERYRQIVETAQEGIWLIDGDNRTIFVNKRFTEIFGYSAEEMMGRTNFELMDEEGKATAKEKLERRKKGISEDFELVYIGKSGQKIWTNVSASPITGDSGNYIGALAMLTDITERKIAEKEKEKMTLEMGKAREQEQLAVTDAVIAGEEKARQEMGRELHDNINQVLAAAQLYLGMFQKNNPVPDKFILSTDKLISSAIEEIRNLAHATISPFIEEESLSVALETLANITERSGAIQATNEFIDFDETTISEKLKLTIYRVVQEQFQNILKYANAKNILLQIKREANTISLLIQDDGVGFDTSQKATGIGMKNIKTRISLFDGDMCIISSPGNGCSLTVRMQAPLGEPTI